MKATMEFNLDDPTDREAHLRCTKSLGLALAVHEFFNHLRSLIKYGDDESMAEHAEILRAKLHEELEANGINMDEILS